MSTKKGKYSAEERQEILDQLYRERWLSHDKLCEINERDPEFLDKIQDALNSGKLLLR